MRAASLLEVSIGKQPVNERQRHRMHQSGEDKNWLVGKPRDEVAGTERGEDRAAAAARARKPCPSASRKIQGEMLKLGLKVSRSTVDRLLRRHALRPPPDHRRSPTWLQFLGQYQDFIWAADFFTVTTARLRTFQVLFFMKLGWRRLMLFKADGVTAASPEIPIA